MMTMATTVETVTTAMPTLLPDLPLLPALPLPPPQQRPLQLRRLQLRLPPVDASRPLIQAPAVDHAPAWAPKMPGGVKPLEQMLHYSPEQERERERIREKTNDASRGSNISRNEFEKVLRYHYTSKRNQNHALK